ncbi:MAG: c-type cytochrome [Campylobacteraceae bacterium]
MKKAVVLGLMLVFASSSVVLAADGAAIYKRCVSCHGKNAEKLPPNGNAIIQGWSAEKIEEAVKGYRDGVYGHKMKALMKGQVGKLTDDEIKAVSQYIATLK